LAKRKVKEIFRIKLQDGKFTVFWDVNPCILVDRYRSLW